MDPHHHDAERVLAHREPVPIRRCNSLTPVGLDPHPDSQERRDITSADSALHPQCSVPHQMGLQHRVLLQSSASVGSIRVHLRHSLPFR